MYYDKESLGKMVLRALDLLYENDIYLITHTPSDWKNHHKNDPKIEENVLTKSHVGERPIVFRYAHYLQNIINDSCLTYLKTLDLDCEYNKNMYDCKRLPSFENGVYPDLIIHKRGSNDSNILVMEFKTWWNTTTTNDEKKLKEFTSHKNVYKYRYGVSVVLEKEKDDCIVKWFEHGKLKSN